MLAAPQPSFSCLMKGTSSQMMEGGWAGSDAGTMSPQISTPKIVSFRRVFRPQARKRGIIYGAGWHDWSRALPKPAEGRTFPAVQEAYEALAHRNDDQHQGRDCQNDDQQVAITQSAGREIRLAELRP
jgi:hypothetical protein